MKRDSQKRKQTNKQRNVSTDRHKKPPPGVPFEVLWKQIRLGTIRWQLRSLASLSGLRIRIAVSCGGGHRRSAGAALLWLWGRPAATALIGHLVWEPPHAVGAALKKKKGDISSPTILWGHTNTDGTFFKSYRLSKLNENVH